MAAKGPASCPRLSPRGSHQIAEIIQGVKFKDGDNLTES